MSAKKLRLVTEETEASIALDAPEAGLTKALDEIADDLSHLKTVKHDVRSWALYGAAASSALTLVGVAAMLTFSRQAPAAVILQPVAAEAVPAQVAVAAAAPAPAVIAAPAPAPVEAVAVPEVAAAPEAPAMDADASVHRALRQLFKGHAKSALAELAPVLEAQPNNVDALAAQALALFDQHKDKAARAVVKKALALSPKHPMANVLRGFMAQVDHDVPQALRSYNRYLHQRPNGAFASELSFVEKSLSTTTHEERHE